MGKPRQPQWENTTIATEGAPSERKGGGREGERRKRLPKKILRRLAELSPSSSNPAGETKGQSCLARTEEIKGTRESMSPWGKPRCIGTTGKTTGEGQGDNPNPNENHGQNVDLWEIGYERHNKGEKLEAKQRVEEENSKENQFYHASPPEAKKVNRFLRRVSKKVKKGFKVYISYFLECKIIY